MADYSIDDILAELDAKKAGVKNSSEKAVSDTDDILYSNDKDYSATSILYDIESRYESYEKEESYAEEPSAEPGYYSGEKNERSDYTLDELTGIATEVDKVLKETEIFENPEDKTELFVKKEEEEEKKPVPAVKKPVETPQEAKEREKRQEEGRLLMLSKERENSDPDDMLDLVNPMEVKEKVIQQVKEQDLAPVSEFSEMYAGNTQGIAGEDLKTIEAKTTEIVEAPTEGKGAKTAPDNDNVKQYVGKKTTDGLIERLNKSLALQREENLKTHRTITLTGTKGAEGLIHPLNIDYKKQIIAATTTLQTENPIVEAQKQAELTAVKKHKLKDFVLEDDGAGEIPDTVEEEEEYDDYDSSGQIWADLNASHKGLKVRLVLLLVMTAITVIVSMFNDLDLFGALGLSESLGFMNVKGDVTSLMYIYLICGVLGFVTCSSVISNGIIRLFTGKADCDTVCSVTAVLSLIGGVAALIDGQSFKLGHCCIYISTALVGLVFNTIGKIYMITRAKRNFKFVSGDSQKYYAQIINNQASVSMLTKVATERIPVVATMRKTEFLTDFLKSSYCDDEADRLSAKLVPVALIAGFVAALLAFFNPFGSEFAIVVDGESPLNWAISSFVAVVAAALPFSMLFAIHAPLARASKKLSEHNTALLGYDAAAQFADVNTVMVDAKALFPAGSVQVAKVKLWHKKNPVIKVSVEDAILMAASLAIHTDGILSYSFYDMTLGNKDLLQKVDNCIYEDNCGMTGWIGTRRVMMGGRQLMQTHHIDLPTPKSERKYCGDLEPVYLAVSGEIVAMFVISMSANKEIKDYLKSFADEKITVLVRTTDSVVTVENISELFDVDTRYIKVLPHEAHNEYNECTKYTSRGSGALSCNGTFSSFAGGILAAKNLVRDFVLSKSLLIGSAALGGFLALLMVVLKQINCITPTIISAYGILMAIIMLALQKLRKY